MPIQAALTPQMTADEINELLKRVYPQLNDEFVCYRAVEVFPGGCTVRLDADERHLRPGGTVSGPSLFTLADIGGYVCVLSHAGTARSCPLLTTVASAPQTATRAAPDSSSTVTPEYIISIAAQPGSFPTSRLASLHAIGSSAPDAGTPNAR